MERNFIFSQMQLFCNHRNFFKKLLIKYFKCKIVLLFLFIIMPATADVSSVENNKQIITIAAVGDIFISRRMIDDSRLHLDSIKLEGDIVTGNFEGVLSSDTLESERSRFILAVPFESADILKKSGFTSLNLANNHSMDKGIKEYNNSKKYLENKGFLVSGYDETGVSFLCNGISVRIAGFTFSGKNNVNNPAEASQIISVFKENIVIIHAHMGDEMNEYITGKTEYFGKTPRGNPRVFARAAIDAGADVVIGHGPHVLRGIELYKGRLIIYSLGNFIFDYPGSEKHVNIPACSIKIKVDSVGLFISAEIHNYLIHKGLPFRDNNGVASRKIYRLTEENTGNGGLLFNKNTNTFFVEEAK